jgi:outer membrane protein assembly factor BamB
MAKLVNTKCPECGARLAIDPDQDQARCDYCGAVSRVENRRHKAPPVPQGVPAGPVIRVGTSAGRIWAAVLVPVLMTLFIGGMTFFQLSRAGGIDTGGGPGSGGSAGQSFGEHMQWISSKQPMLIDLTGDGVADPVGWIRFLGSGGSMDHVAAFDAVTGTRLWTTLQLADGSQTHEARAALAGDKLLVADPTGMLHAHSLQNGQRIWTAMLGERVERLCGGGPGQVRVEKKDEHQVTVALATGQVVPSGKIDDAAPCGGLWTDVPGRTPAVFLGGDTFDNITVQPVIDGMDVKRVVIEPRTGTYVALGSRKPGTAVPAAARYTPPAPVADRKRGPSSWMNRPDVTPMWLAAIPAVNPMTVNPGSTELGTISAGRLVAPYQLAGSKGTWRLAALDLRTGQGLWDVDIPLSDTSSVNSTVASERQIFVGIWTYLHVFDLATGHHRLTIGKW